MSKMKVNKEVVEEVKKLMEEKFHLKWDRLPKNVQNALVDVEVNRNWSWTRDIYERNKDCLDNVALFYRGTEITHKEMFEQAELYASRFKAMGIREGMEVPICMSNSPELYYSMFALNMLGAKVNCFGEFDPDYITEIIDSCDADFVICGDDKYEKLKPSIDNSSKNTILMFSLADSLKNEVNPYQELDKDFYDFKNRVNEYKASDDRIMSLADFREVPCSDDVKVENARGDLNTVSFVTYTSGSTNSKRPKAIRHTNRAPIGMAELERVSLSQMANLRGANLIPSHSNTGWLTSFSDVLEKGNGCMAVIEPLYKPDDPRAFINFLVINKPNYVVAPRQMIVDSFKLIDSDPAYKNLKLPYLMMLLSVGEPTSKGEEKFLNKMMKRLQCGKEKLGITVPLSIGGGNCELGGLFFTMYRKLQNLNPKYAKTKDGCQLKPYPMSQIAVCDENGNILPENTEGYLLAKTPTMMEGYKNNQEATDALYMTDNNGEVWTKCNVHAVIDSAGTVKMLGRVGNEVILNDGTKLPLHKIGELVESDTKHILSYEVVNVDNSVVVHVEFMPGVKNDKKKILMGIETRIIKELGSEVAGKVVYRVRSHEESFPKTACGKRSYNDLKAEGLDKTIKPVINEIDEVELRIVNNHYFLDPNNCETYDATENKPKVLRRKYN